MYTQSLHHCGTVKLIVLKDNAGSETTFLPECVNSLSPYLPSSLSPSARVLYLTNADTLEDVVNFAKRFISAARVPDIIYVTSIGLGTNDWILPQLNLSSLLLRCCWICCVIRVKYNKVKQSKNSARSCTVYLVQKEIDTYINN